MSISGLPGSTQPQSVGDVSPSTAASSEESSILTKLTAASVKVISPSNRPTDTSPGGSTIDLGSLKAFGAET